MYGLIFQIWIVLIGVGFIYVVSRHLNMVRTQFKEYMIQNHPNEWSTMIQDIPWLPISKHIYYSSEVFDFIWLSKDYLGDDKVKRLKTAIRRSGWHVIMYFLFAGINGLLMAIVDSQFN